MIPAREMIGRKARLCRHPRMGGYCVMPDCYLLQQIGQVVSAQTHTNQLGATIETVTIAFPPVGYSRDQTLSCSPEFVRVLE
jgi:hypothetical protein